jgi:hypothetical protein
VAYLGTGDICPAGSECPVNSTYPAACSPGKYAPLDGEDQCLDCPAGKNIYSWIGNEDILGKYIHMWS